MFPNALFALIALEIALVRSLERIDAATNALAASALVANAAIAFARIPAPSARARALFNNAPSSFARSMFDNAQDVAGRVVMPRALAGMVFTMASGDMTKSRTTRWRSRTHSTSPCALENAPNACDRAFAAFVDARAMTRLETSVTKEEECELLDSPHPSSRKARDRAWMVAKTLAVVAAGVGAVGVGALAAKRASGDGGRRGNGLESNALAHVGVGKEYDCAVKFKPEYEGFRICNSQWSNAGDLLGEPVVREMLERRFKCDAYAYITHRLKNKGSHCLWSVGSMMENVRAGDVVWGLGVWHADVYAAARLGTPLDFEVRGVRGPRTAELLDQVHGTTVAPVGDPGFLVSTFYSEIKPTREYKCLIRHVSGDRTVAPEGAKSFTPGDFGEDWHQFLVEVARCSHVYSSSLHGLIVADSFGIPSRWFFPSDQPVVEVQSDFKYRDWLEMCRRSVEWLRPRHNILGMLNESSYAPPLSDAVRSELIDKLIGSFPFDMFTTVADDARKQR